MSDKGLGVILPLLISFLPSSLGGSQGKLCHNSEPSLMNSIWLITIIFLSVIFTSIQLPLIKNTVVPNSAGRDLLGPFAISLLASIYLRQPHFLIVHLITIHIISPWYGSLINLIEHSLCWFWDTTLKAKCATVLQQAKDDCEPEPTQLADSAEWVDNNEGDLQQEQPTFEGDDAV